MSPKWTASLEERRTTRGDADPRRSLHSARNVKPSDMTIPYVGRCLGSGKPPREETQESQADGRSGVCVACSGRFELDNGTIVEHETAPADERESIETSDDS